MHSYKVLLVSATIYVLLPAIAFGAELSKSDATKLLSSMGYKNVAVATVINGIGMEQRGMQRVFNSPNVALVVGYNEGHLIKDTFYYDKDIGWLYYQIDFEKRKAVRLWTLKGYTEVKSMTP